MLAGSQPLIIAIDALAANYGGTAYAGVEISRALARRDDVRRVVVVARAGSIVDRGTVGVRGIARMSLRATLRPELLQRIAWEGVRLPALVRRDGIAGVLSLSGMLPRSPGRPLVCLQANPVPYERPVGLANRIRRRAVAHTARHASALYVPSSHLAQLVGPLPRVRIVPLGVDHSRFRPTPQTGDELLCVADFYEHKHHDLLIDAYSALPEPRPTLRLIGDPAVDGRTYARVRDLAQRTEGVVVAGRVSSSMLIAAYRRARALLIASSRESFCMPLAEALSSGVPAVARDHPALRETGGPGAIYVAGYDPRDWKRAIARIVSDDSLHTRLRAAGIEHAGRFSWDAFAERLVDDLRSDG